MSGINVESVPFSELIQIPGPNPLLTPGGPGEWDEHWIECCDVIKDEETYYLYYHGTADDREKWPRGGYRIGVATAPHPLGPWRRHEGSPILDISPAGNWDDWHVACAFVLKEGAGRYLMWYSGAPEAGGEGPGGERPWGVGLASAASPLGPWEKCGKAPVIPAFGYVGGVVLVDGVYHLYTEHPIGSRGPDYGPISLATSPSPEGPWAPYEGNPVLVPGEWGAWDDGGFSEAKVSYRSGVFHMFYGGAKLHPTRIRSQESIGYAWSRDGRRFVKSPRNPVALREREPDAAAFAEVHHYLEPPLVYCFHTLRYASRPGVEDIGVQILTTARPFCVPMPVLAVDSLGPGEQTGLESCPTICLEHVSRLSLTVSCRFSGGERGGLRIHLRSSWDGRRYDTVDLQTLELTPQTGQDVACKTWPVDAAPRFLRVTVENADPAIPVGPVEVAAVLKG